MKLKAFCICAAVLAVAAAAQAQSGERAQEMQRVVDGLNSPDPVTRMITLEDVMERGDRNLKRVAISTALGSSDQTLRTAGVEAAFSQKPSFVIEFVAGKEGYLRYWERSGGSIEVLISQFDADSGTFLAHTPYSRRENGQTVAFPGALSGDRISFHVDISDLYLHGHACRGSVSARDGGTLMKGTMSCNDFPYDIQVDLMR